LNNVFESNIKGIFYIVPSQQVTGWCSSGAVLGILHTHITQHLDYMHIFDDIML